MGERDARRVGFWSALIASVLGFAYLAVLLASLLTKGIAYPPSLFAQLAGGVTTLFTAATLVVLFAAIREVPGKRGILGTLGVSFTILFAAVVSINRFVQLTVVRSAGVTAPDLARFLPYATDSVMFALEMLGWGFFIAIAALFIAPLFGGDRLGTWIRWLLVAFASLSLASVVSFAANSPLLAIGFVAWGPILLAICVLLTRFFRREPAATPPDSEVSNKRIQQTARRV